MRLNKFISQSGVTSRRKADELISAGRVTVDNVVVRELGSQINPGENLVAIDGKQIQLRVDFTYLAFNKPIGYVCTHAEFRGEKSIFNLLPQQYHSLKIAGRLDKDSSGLLILTDDGDFIARLTHPKFQHEKEYDFMVGKPLSAVQLAHLRRGVNLAEGLARADRIFAKGNCRYGIVLHQGWKRQIRRMIQVVGAEIVSLSRTRVGNFRLGALGLGAYLPIEKEQIMKKSIPLRD